MRGQRIGRYEVQRELARGGMGVVFLAHDPEQDRPVAIKLLLGGRGSPKQRRRFQRETEALFALRHRSLVKVLDLGEHQECPFLVLEYVAGESLQERIDRFGGLDERDAAQLVRDLARAIEYAHEVGVLHRDLKPANVLIDGDGKPKLTDFGLVRALDGEQSRLSQSGITLGTPGYMPPEQARGDLEALSPASDVYGLGAILYASLTGLPPIQGASLAEVLVATENMSPESPSRGRPGLDPTLEAICLRCLAKAPGNRYPSAGLLAEDLSRWLEAPPAAERSPRVVAAVAVVLVLTLVAAAASVSLPARGPAADLAEPAPVTSKAPPPAAPAPDSARERAASRVAEGRALARDRRWRLALIKADAAIAQDPDSAAAYVLRGSVKLELRDVRGSLADSERAITLDPTQAQAFVNRGSAKVLLRDVAGALADYQEAVRLDPGNPRAYMSRGYATAILRRSPRAGLRDLNRAIQLDPTEGQSYYFRGVVHLRLKDLGAARADFERALEIDPNNPIAYRRLAWIKVRQQDRRGALSDLDRAIRLAPRHAGTVYNRGAIRRKLQEVAGAKADFERAIELDPQLVKAYVDLAAMLGAKDLRAALAVTDRAVRANPKSTLAWFSRGSIKISLKDNRGALTDFDRALELDPQSARALANRGAVKRKLNDPRGAAIDFEQALRWNPKLRGADLLRGFVREQLGRASRW